LYSDLEFADGGLNLILIGGVVAAVVVRVR
jgi:hypothetical protein